MSFMFYLGIFIIFPDVKKIFLTLKIVIFKSVTSKSDYKK